MSWHKTYTARWGKILADDEVAAWESEIVYEVGNVKQPEMEAAIRSLAADERRIGRGKYPITCNDLISRIIKLRGEAAQANKPPPGECALCHYGWVSFVPLTDAHHSVIGAQVATLERPGLMDIPCLCAAGERALAGYLKSQKPPMEAAPANFLRLRQQVIDVARRGMVVDRRAPGPEQYAVEDEIFRG